MGVQEKIPRVAWLPLFQGINIHNILSTVLSSQECIWDVFIMLFAVLSRSYLGIAAIIAIFTPHYFLC